MVITYLPADFWGVACTREGSAIPKVMWRSTYMGLPALLAALCGQFKHVLNDLVCIKDGEETCFSDVPGSFITPFALLVALLTSYRVNNAHSKWETANRTAMSLHEVLRPMCPPIPHRPFVPPAPARAWRADLLNHARLDHAGGVARQVSRLIISRVCTTFDHTPEVCPTCRSNRRP